MSGPLGTGATLSIEPRSKSLGYAACDGAGVLVDWGGFRSCRSRHAYYRSCALKLMRGYGPEYVLIEDCDASSSRRRPPTRKLLKRIADDAEREGIIVVKITRDRVLKRFCLYGIGSSFDLAEAVCAEYPELRSRLPRPRKPWESEHYSTALFGAAARLRTKMPR